MRQGEPASEHTILLVDDEAQIRSMLHDLLVCHGYKVIQAADGLDALEKFKLNVQEIKLVVTDIVMPRLDGLSSIKIMRTITPSVKVLLMSGYASDQPAPDGVSLIPKPFTPADFLQAIRSSLGD
ncbi:response regulator [Geomonas sp. Red69]|uniref:Response regulator n=1 Tax=Geomonas diazotrophica TaxID=2843197 RepID=A0ABX8JMQ4_9BACT|nr:MULTISPECIES: response regulator [Geomonas]MBU5636951.1 response regulator [Geomonas diazotrophica]QWV98852.1 response regulator [Geomonas nitrogeniifigens]QXE87999.1 response regulator [Geomonas nitrogeniifigens]